ncbi:MAG: hypothetical protein IJ524_05410 [Bacteroidales bacterium]|nr:hypothetical protein [Bacteroidales bacterium]
MEHRVLTDNEFDQLWQEASARSQGHRLSEGYGQWQRNRRRTLGTLAMLTVLAAVALPLLTGSPRNDVYEHVYCNRTGVADGQWAELADALLMEA